MDPAELLRQLGIDLVKNADDYEPVEGTYDFKMFTRDAAGNGLSVKAFVEKDEDGEEEMFISGVASSTIKDLHGDTMLPSALVDMERQANANLTIFLNHEYRVPEDVAGSVVKAKISSSVNDEETGAPIYDLDFEKIRINKQNERAVDTFKALQGTNKTKGNGVKLGLSIGARIPEGGAIRNKKTGALLISHVTLLETSIVSIPANPRSWIQNMVKSLRAGPATVTKTVIEDGEEEIIITTTPAVTEAADTGSTAPLQAQGKCPTCGRAKNQGGSCKDPYHSTKDASETVPDVPVTEPAVTDSAPSQGAPQSEPGADGAAPEPVVAAAAPDPSPAPEGMVKALIEAQSALGEVTTKFIASETARLELETRLLDVTKERDQIAVAAKDAFADLDQLLQRLSRLPVGQKASFRSITDDFDGLSKGLEDIYGPGFLERLRSPE